MPDTKDDIVSTHAVIIKEVSLVKYKNKESLTNVSVVFYDNYFKCIYDVIVFITEGFSRYAGPHIKQQIHFKAIKYQNLTVVNNK